MAASLLGAFLPQERAAVDGTAWERAQGGILVLEHLGVPTGVAAVIDERGLLLAHKTSLRTGPMAVRMRDGSILTATVVAQDEVTQATLLQIPPIRTELRALSVALTARAGERVLAATPAGPVYGQIAGTDRVGQMRPSLRYLPLSEVWLEASAATQSSSVLVNERGEIVGLLGASLAEETRPAAQKESFGGGAGVGASAARANYGPGSLQVSYAIGPKVMKRVVDGFRSPSREVKHPTVGILFRMSSGAGGVILDTVLDGSTAQLAGLRAGDRVLTVEGKTISDSVQLAVVLFEATPGSTITIAYERDGQTKTAKVRVTSQDMVLTSRTIHL